MMRNLTDALLSGRRLESLVENQTSYCFENVELHVFETYQEAEKVLLNFHDPILASMLRGKKVMHLQDRSCFDFIPGESLILPADEPMYIDFLEANPPNPTQCLAMAIAEQKINVAVNYLNEHKMKADGEWEFADVGFHFTNDSAIQQIIQRIMFLATEQHACKDTFVDMMIQELIIRILQTQTKKAYIDFPAHFSGHRLSYVISFIRENIDKPLNVKMLANEVCMSESNFHRVFRNEMAMSPTAFIMEERVQKAKLLLKNPEVNMKDVCFDCGFNSLSYFNRVFKRSTGCSPKKFQQQLRIVPMSS